MKDFFFKIRPGLWALKSYKDKLPDEIFPKEKTTKIQQEESGHTYYQGLLVEIGNLKNYKTSVPGQDKNKKFLNKRLGDIVTIEDFYKFSYEHIVNKAKTIDVLWFNQRKMPSKLFEIEHSTDIQNSLLKFVELQDFYVEFCIVANRLREREFTSKLSLNAFLPIQKRTNFIGYDKLSEWHTKIHAIVTLEKEMNL